MPRLFTALAIPDDIGDHLSLLAGGIAGAHWVRREDYHITLQYIGDVDGVTAGEFVSALSRLRHQSFSLRVKDIRSFGGRYPRAIYAGVEGDDLPGLHAAHQGAARKAGLKPERRKFIPHITLARLSGVSGPAVLPFLESHGGYLSRPFEVTQYGLFSSRGSRGGGPYIVEQLFELTARAQSA